MVNKPQWIKAPDISQDIPEEMPEYLEKRLGILKEEENGVVFN